MLLKYWIHWYSCVIALSPVTGNAHDLLSWLATPTNGIDAILNHAQKPWLSTFLHGTVPKIKTERSVSISFLRRAILDNAIRYELPVLPWGIHIQKFKIERNPQRALPLQSQLMLRKLGEIDYRYQISDEVLKWSLARRKTIHIPHWRRNVTDLGPSGAEFVWYELEGHVRCNRFVHTAHVQVLTKSSDVFLGSFQFWERSFA